MDETQLGEDDLISFSVFEVDQTFASHITDLALSNLLQITEDHSRRIDEATPEEYIYLCVVVFLKLSSWTHLERAQQCADLWLSEAPRAQAEERERRAKICRLIIALDRYVCSASVNAIEQKADGKIQNGLELTRSRTLPSISFLKECSDFNIAVSLRESYTRNGSLDDLSLGLKTIKEVVKETAPNHPRRAFSPR
jgi:hypothetical protein